MTARRLDPLVHPEWSARWFGGDPGLAAVFGPPPRLEDLVARARGLPERPSGLASVHWCGEPPPDDALVVVAGQQPVLLGGPALVVNKCATAIALAQELDARLDRPVRPVFLLATQDHDSSEIDHLDLIDPSNGHLTRLRAALTPRNEMFARCRWDEPSLKDAWLDLKSRCGDFERRMDGFPTAIPVAAHVEQLLTRVFGHTGLGIVHAHELPAADATPILERALGDHAAVRATLVQGARQLERLELRVPFDPDDERPVVLQSTRGRRRRIEAGQQDAALADLASAPDDFSPHAALRPVVQAATLPVVAQVVGPSEQLYLGQARSLHEWAAVPAPILVPRLEATRVRAGEFDRAEDLLARVRHDHGFVDAELSELTAAAELATRALTRAVAERAPGLEARARRLDRRITRDLQRLARAPEHHTLGRDGLLQRLRPRGRPQDAVLAWLPEALAAPDPRAWADELIRTARPLEAPRHVLLAHTPDAHAPETPHG